MQPSKKHRKKDFLLDKVAPDLPINSRALIREDHDY
jgi:hypothetical protein